MKTILALKFEELFPSLKGAQAMKKEPKKEKKEDMKKKSKGKKDCM